MIFNYDLIVEELYSYTDADIRDMFVRMNKYVVKLSKQELRHSLEGRKVSAEFAERRKWKFWKDKRVFSENQLNRMRSVEFSAELVILLIEGPQDKKKVLDLYYHSFEARSRRDQRSKIVCATTLSGSRTPQSRIHATANP